MSVYQHLSEQRLLCTGKLCACSHGELFFYVMVSSHMSVQVLHLIPHYTVKVAVDYTNHCRCFGPCCTGS